MKANMQTGTLQTVLYIPDETPKSIRKYFFKNTPFLQGTIQICMNPFCRAPRDDPRAMTEHDCPIFLPQRSSKLPTSTTTIQNQYELKSAPICSPRRRFGAKLCEYVPLMTSVENYYNQALFGLSTETKSRASFIVARAILDRLRSFATRGRCTISDRLDPAVGFWSSRYRRVFFHAHNSIH